MTAALGQGGTSFDALYVNVNGESGYFDRSLHAYGREGEPCDRCGTPIRRIAFTNRSSYFCPRCQPAPRAADPNGHLSHLARRLTAPARSGTLEGSPVPGHHTSSEGSSMAKALIGYMHSDPRLRSTRSRRTPGCDPASPSSRP